MASKDFAQIQQIELSKLALPQLQQIQRQLDQELVVFQDSLQTLKLAQQKFQDSGDCLERVTPESEGKEVLVPLTASMYVPGKVADANSVILDIGTGYFIQKDVDGAKDYFKRKVQFVTKQMEKIQAMGIEKTKFRDAVGELIETKIQAHIAAQQQLQQAAKS